MYSRSDLLKKIEGNGGSGQEKGGLRARGKRVVERPEGEAAAGEGRAEWDE